MGPPPEGLLGARLGDREAGPPAAPLDDEVCVGAPKSSASRHQITAAFEQVVRHVGTPGKAALKPPQFQQNLVLQELHSWWWQPPFLVIA